MKPGRPEVVEHALDTLNGLWELPWKLSFSAGSCTAHAKLNITAGKNGTLSIEIAADDWQIYPGRLGNTRFTCEVIHTPRGPETDLEQAFLNLMPLLCIPTVWFNQTSVDNLARLVKQVQDYLQRCPVFIKAFGDRLNLPAPVEEGVA
jgi:hypothetical protein